MGLRLLWGLLAVAIAVITHAIALYVLFYIPVGYQGAIIIAISYPLGMYGAFESAYRALQK